MATLKDVAKDAGVSIATVSCCLSGSRYVKPETRTKIMDSIEKLKYIPNASARDLRSTSTNRIGVVPHYLPATEHGFFCESNPKLRNTHCFSGTASR